MGVCLNRRDHYRATDWKEERRTPDCITSSLEEPRHRLQAECVSVVVAAACLHHGDHFRATDARGRSRPCMVSFRFPGHVRAVSPPRKLLSSSRLEKGASRRRLRCFIARGRREGRGHFLGHCCIVPRLADAETKRSSSSHRGTGRLTSNCREMRGLSSASHGDEETRPSVAGPRHRPPPRMPPARRTGGGHVRVIVVYL